MDLKFLRKGLSQMWIDNSNVYFKHPPSFFIMALHNMIDHENKKKVKSTINNQSN